jgi:hypothetical protein
MGVEGLTYLSGRGVTMDSVETFRIGQVVEPLPGHEMMRGRICIPYIKKRATVALKFRCIRDHDCKVEKCPKYLADGSQWLYNSAAVDAVCTHIGVSEGEIDAIILTQSGIPSVGVPGVEGWQGHPWWSEIFRGHRRILVFADNDTSNDANPGFKLARQILKDLPRAKHIVLPDDMDVNETFLEFGVEELYKRAGMVWPQDSAPKNTLPSSLLAGMSVSYTSRVAA